MDFFLRGKYLGSASSPAYNPLTIYNHNIAWFCPACGEVWGRILVDPTKAHHTLTRGCSKCGPAWMDDPAGCLLSTSTTGVDWNLPQILQAPDTPFDVLLNEFNQLEKLA